MNSALSSSARHPIRVVARRTGLTAEVIRAWEQRHGVVSPSRTQAGRRLYSDADVERLMLLRRAVQGGRSIGQVASLADASLRALLAEDSATATALREAADAGSTAQAPIVLREALAAVRRLDALRLDAVLRTAALTIPAGRLADEVLAPLMHEIGEAWAGGRLGVAHEHVASAVVRAVVASLPLGVTPTDRASVLVVAPPAGQRHELGAMAAAAAAAADGWRVVYLGADTPAADIARATRTTGAVGVALSLTYPHGDPAVRQELRELRRLLPDAAIVVGGAASSSYDGELAAIGAVTLADTAGFHRALGTFRQGAA